MSVKHGPFTVSAVVILGCLVGGVALVTAVKDVPAVVVAVVLACGIATLTYTLLGGVSEAGFHLGPLSLTGSGAMLVGSAFLINNALDPQLMQIRRENRADQFGFNFDQHAAPPKGWFALNDRTGVPLDVTFTDPVTNEVVKTVKPPPAVSLPLKLAADEGNDRYVVLGTDAGSGQGTRLCDPIQPHHHYWFSRMAAGDRLWIPAPLPGQETANCQRAWSGDGAIPSAEDRACHFRSRLYGSPVSLTTTSGAATPRRELNQITLQVSAVAKGSWCC